MKTLYQSKTVSVSTTLKNDGFVPVKFKRSPFGEIKKSILGNWYKLSIVLIGKKRSRLLNFKYRNKNCSTDVLSFSLSPLLGEIFITPSVAKIKSAKLDKSYEDYLLFLVIHASLHLKGLKHSDKMERYELTYYNRYRYRHL